MNIELLIKEVIFLEHHKQVFKTCVSNH